MKRTFESILSALVGIMIIAGAVSAQDIGARKQALLDAMKTDRQAVLVALIETVQEEIPTVPARKAFVDKLFAKLNLDIVADTRADAHRMLRDIDHLRSRYDVSEEDLTTIVGMLGELPEPEGAPE